MNQKQKLLELIDQYAEARHIQGHSTYNIKTEAARQAVIEALSGVQALSAAPAVPNGDELRRIARSARTSASDDASPTEYVLAGWKAAMLAASPTPPAEQQSTKETSGGFHVWRDISTAPKDGSRFVATGHNYGLYSEVRHACVAQWFRGCWMEASDWNETSELKYLTHWMPLPSPPDDVAAPAEQQAITPEMGNSVSAQGAAITSEFGAVYAELCCDEVSRAVDVVVERCISLTQDATGIKVVYDPIILANALRTELRGFADRTHALRMEQAAPKAAPGEPDGFGSAEHWKEKAQYWAGVAHRLRGEALRGEPVDGIVHPPAPQQEAQEPCQTCAAMARTAMMDQVSFDRKPDCYGIRQITDDDGIEEWEDIRTSPDVAREEARDMMATGRGEIYEVVPLWTTPQPAPAPLSDDTERLNWLLWKLPGDALRYVVGELADTSSGAEFRAAIDAARKQGGA